jgi:O-antigen/teichoic acid export membrane protein
MRTERSAGGLRAILIATAIAGALGYAIQLLAPALLPTDAAYVTFSVYWSTIYLCVAALSGIQQEITRAATPVTNEPPSSTLRTFTLIAGAALVVIVAALSVLVGPAILPDHTLLLAIALGIGVVGYLVMAVLSGVLYGLQLWRAVATLTILDILFRAVLVIAALLLGLDDYWVALAVSLPFGLAFLAVWMIWRRSVVGQFRLDVGLRRLLLHVLGTVGAAAAMGVMMNGLPLLLGLTTRSADAGVLAGLILAITLTRAPIVIPLLALQSYLISIFRGGGEAVRRRVLLALLAVAGVVAILAGLAWLIGPWAIGWVSSGKFVIEPAMMAAITASAGLVALMCVTGPALVSHREHVAYVAGWAVAALLTVGLILVPIDLSSRVALALLAAPACGLAIHVTAVMRGSWD